MIKRNKGVEHTIRRRGMKIKKPYGRIVYYLQFADFYNVSFLRGIKIATGLITGLIGQWRLETHTFHFPFDEWTITLKDVAIQLGVQINGNSLVGRNNYNVYEFYRQYLGKIPPKSCERSTA